MMRFSHRGKDGRLYWVSDTRAPGDSRVEQVSCKADWFYGQMTNKEKSNA